ncbi:hypothetical protein TVAG_319540 [Trichomonas vaginalis G3]|uniref:Importin N-terminal domain-containing protein n=1 Tax=Trichomonas vaginalis (strain ATCC PRA-98 / G3) TaxID=412133 RepID=A2DQA2_TRIV3|nr:armadillo (ARM) repeat-containing protein family [Trichomonas vaginalis G3]EAY17359.1 hypothetical protein TVAG_319540 [Trichomonas vaginalis G3]KAI5491367.1 armadillo (ARM) repeat-containing protein family [Trichomonas vaginalis G3]|eukprot:XP_001330728.1 hypothetical protein [Trichomonas vaginalis G3]
MGDLLQYITIAHDQNHPSFNDAQNALVTMQNETPIETIQQILQILTSQNLEYKQLFLSIVILTNCIRNLITPLTENNPDPTINADDSLIREIFDVSFHFFLHENSTINALALNLAQIIISPLKNRILDFEIIPKLANFLVDDSLSHGISLALQCLITIYGPSEYYQNLVEFIPNVMTILQKYPNDYDIIAECYNYLYNFISNFTSIFNEEQFAQLVQNAIVLLEKTPLKKSCYRFLHAVFGYFPNIIIQNLNQIFTFIYDDVRPDQDDEILQQVHSFIDRVIIKSKDYEFDRDLMYQLLPKLFITVKTIKKEDVLEPFDSTYFATHTILKFIKDFDRQFGMEQLNDFIIQNSSSDDLISHEAAFRMLSILITFISLEELTSDYIDLCINGMKSDCIRVQYHALQTLKKIINQFPEKPNLYYSFFENYESIVSQSEDVCINSIRVAIEIVKCQGFNFYDELLQFVNNILMINVFHLSDPLYKLSKKVSELIHEPEFIDNFLLLFSQCLIENISEISEFMIDGIVRSTEVLISGSSENFEGVALNLMELCYQILSSHESYSFFDLLSALISRRFESIIENSVPFYDMLLRNFEITDNDELISHMHYVIPKVVVKEILNERYVEFLQLILNYYRSISGVSNKIGAIKCFKKLFEEENPELKLLFNDVLNSFKLLMSNIHIMMQKYGSSIPRLLLSMARLLLKVVEKWDQQCSERAACFLMHMSCVISSTMKVPSEFTKTFCKVFTVISQKYPQIYEMFVKKGPYIVHFIEQLYEDGDESDY